MQFAVVVPWHNPEQLERFGREWRVNPSAAPEWLVLQQDADRSGCAVTKNAGIARAIDLGAEAVVVLDDDCFPDTGEGYSRTKHPLRAFAAEHIQNLQPRPVVGFGVLTEPPSRGTPYRASSRLVERDVAASMGFWSEVGDYCAARQLAFDAGPMEPHTLPAEEWYRYFPLSGMNLAFRVEWLPWATFIDVPRYDDIWMGWLWQKEAYRRGACFALDGPKVRHSRQSNVWANLVDEARYAEQNETLWRQIATSTHATYPELRGLLPV